MIKESLFILLGFVSLVGGAELLVKGATSIAKSFGVSALIIGLTVVAFGTSAPELFVSVNAALKGTADVSIGNVVGSNVFNILVIIGLSACIGTVHIAPAVLKREMPLMLIVMLVFIGLSLDGVLSRWDGVLLTIGILAYLLMNYVLVKRRRLAQSLEAMEGRELSEESIGVALSITYVCIGLLAMVVGSGWIVDNAVVIAHAFGVPDLIVGITLIAVGTSLPEVAATTVAARRGQADLAVGNAIGSNLFNVLCVLGITAIITPLKVASEVVNFDNWIMLAACIIVYLFMRWNGRLGKVHGLFLVFFYFAYITYLIADINY